MGGRHEGAMGGSSIHDQAGLQDASQAQMDEPLRRGRGGRCLGSMCLALEECAPNMQYRLELPFASGTGTCGHGADGNEGCAISRTKVTEGAPWEEARYGVPAAVPAAQRPNRFLADKR